MGCGCGGSSWTPTPPDGVNLVVDASGPQGIENPATFWTGPSTPPADPVEADPVGAPAEA